MDGWMPLPSAQRHLQSSEVGQLPPGPSVGSLGTRSRGHRACLATCVPEEERTWNPAVLNLIMGESGKEKDPSLSP